MASRTPGFRRICTAAAVISPLIVSAPSFAESGMDGEEAGAPLSMIAGIGWFVGIPAAVIALVYFIAYVPKRKSSSTDISTR
ncbi:MAG: hypothetical protein RL745_1038 [Actinomycetota bacterium]|jgi:hypothetical protein